ncbi:uncharacterized protein METZ01_LOCUS415797 [marine metagenome]|uniref:Uncharacterized protein n=1 Tax=marine metagenome TaxID=408172 RepID=A0A382WW64_9ZZZZ
MALSNYTELQASVADFLNRSDLTDVIPDFIKMTESELNRVLRTREMSVRTQGPISKQYVKLPVDFLGLRNIELMTSPVTVLEYRNLQNLDAHRAIDASGKPIYYSIMQNNIEFAPVPDSEYTLEIVYYQALPALADNTTNWLLDSHPDIYLYGSLMQSAPYLQADERIGVWAGKFQQILEQLKTSDEKARFSGTTPTITFSSFG